MDFRLEDRYLVIKIDKLTRSEEDALHQEFGHKMVDCVVIESDWPEYTPVVDMLFGRIDREASNRR